MSGSTICMDMEVRKIRPAELFTLGQILNISDSWKKLMAVVPKEGTNNCPKFNSEHFSMIEQAVQQQRRNAAEIFLEEWGTMGRKRPTLRILLDLLVKAELFRAADYIAGDILKEKLPERPKCGPAAPVDISDETIEKLLKQQATTIKDPFDLTTSVSLGSSTELNVSKIVYFIDSPVECINSSNKNMQSTKLASTNPKLNDGYIGINPNVAEKDISDLIKFSTTEINNKKDQIHNLILNKNDNTNVVNVGSNVMAGTVNQDVLLPTWVYENQELTSKDLPLCLNEFKRLSIRENQELQSAELPACLNSTFMSNHSSIQLSIDVSSHESSIKTNSSDNRNLTEVSSTELPQCLLESESDAHQTYDNVIIDASGRLPFKNVVSTQELPVVILE